MDLGVKVIFAQAQHVWFDWKERKLHCDHCPRLQDLDEDEAQGRIEAFANAHRACPFLSTEESRQKAIDKEFQAGLEQDVHQTKTERLGELCRKVLQ